MKDVKENKQKVEDEDVEKNFNKEYSEAVTSFFRSVVDTLKEI